MTKSNYNCEKREAQKRVKKGNRTKTRVVSMESYTICILMLFLPSELFILTIGMIKAVNIVGSIHASNGKKRTICRKGNAVCLGSRVRTKHTGQNVYLAR